MKRLVALALALTASGCTCIFNPDRVRPPVCPHTSDFCGAQTNASAACVADGGTSCEYTCAAGFVDSNGDLGNEGGDGCDYSCAGAVVPTNPQGLVATVGVPGSVDLQWPVPVPPQDAYLLCVGPAFENCSAIPANSVCTNGVCTVTLNDLPINQRLQARVRGVSYCRGPGPEGTAPTASFTPVNPFSATSFDIDVTPTGCVPSVTEPSASELQVQLTQANCLVKLKLGDTEWGDLTAQVEMSVTTLMDGPVRAGLGVQANTTGHVAGIGFVYQDSERPTFIGYWPATNFLPVLAATSVFAPKPNEWVTLRVVVKGDVFSVSTANQGEGLVERLRWTSPEPNAASLKGKPGLFAYGAGTLRFRNFRLSTAATLPTGSPTSVGFTFSNAMLPPELKVSGMGLNDPAVVTCPGHFIQADPCNVPGGCVPPSGARCLRVQRQGLVGTNALFDLPAGIDTTQPWSASFRFGSADAGFSDPNFVSSMHGPMLGVAGGRAAPLRALSNGDLGAPLQLSTWNQVVFRFQPDAGVEVRVNGQAPMGFPRPAAWDRHPGAFHLGGTNNFFSLGNQETYITDIQVTQP
jgi:hypothetical protein